MEELNKAYRIIQSCHIGQGGDALFAVEVNEQPAVSEEETQDVIVAGVISRKRRSSRPTWSGWSGWQRKNVPIGALFPFKDIVDHWVKTAMLEGDPI